MIEIKVLVKSNGENIVVQVKDSKLIGYTFGDGDEIVSLGNYNDFVRPIWEESQWIEGATQEEVRQRDDDKKPRMSTSNQRLLDLEMAIAEIFGGGM